VNRDNSTNAATGFLRDARVLNVTMTPVDVSSSAIREAVAHGESIDSLTSPSVASIIRDRSLYVGQR
jgi:nicotinic acid mononucleotide adenylyltransferase